MSNSWIGKRLFNLIENFEYSHSTSLSISFFAFPDFCFEDALDAVFTIALLDMSILSQSCMASHILCVTYATPVAW